MTDILLLILVLQNTWLIFSATRSGVNQPTPIARQWKPQPYHVWVPDDEELWNMERAEREKEIFNGQEETSGT